MIPSGECSVVSDKWSAISGKERLNTLVMFEAKASDYFQGASDHFLVPVSEVPKTIWQVFGIELLKIYSLSEVGMNTK